MHLINRVDEYKAYVLDQTVQKKMILNTFHPHDESAWKVAQETLHFPPKFIR